MNSPVTIVSGQPRSGTSLMMSMLHAGGLPLLVDDARAADVSNPAGYFEYTPVKRTHRDTSWVAAARGKAVKVVSSLIVALPIPEYSYRVIFMRREEREVVASQNAMLERSQGGTSTVSHAARDVTRLVELNRLEAERCVAWLHDQPNFDVLETHYARLVAEPEAAAAEVAAFLGGGFDVKAMAACVDPSLYRQRQP